MDNSEIRNSYVYMHTRKGKNNPFYIGCSGDMKYNEKAYSKRYYRGYRTSKVIALNKKGKPAGPRNSKWIDIYNKFGRDVIILADGLTKQEANTLEVELTIHYRNLGMCEANLYTGKSTGNGESHKLWKDIIEYESHGVTRHTFKSKLRNTKYRLSDFSETQAGVYIRQSGRMEKLYFYKLN